MVKVVISILHYDKIQDTKACLESLMQCDFKNIDVTTCVLDNASVSGFDLETKDYKKIGLESINSDTNLGFTGGHNKIFAKFEKRDFDYFLLLNNDTLLEKNFLPELLKSFEDKNVGAAVPKIYFTKGREYHSTRYSEDELGRVIWYAGGFIDWKNVMSKHIGIDEVDNGQFDEKKNIDFATGACLLIRKDIIVNIGLFDPRYFLYFEDADLSQKIIKNKYKIIYQPKSTVWHNNAGSSGSGSELHDYYLTRNRLLFGMKYAPLKIRAFLLKECIGLLRNGRKWQKIGIRDYFLRQFGKGSFK